MVLLRDRSAGLVACSAEVYQTKWDVLEKRKHLPPANNAMPKAVSCRAEKMPNRDWDAALVGSQRPAVTGNRAINYYYLIGERRWREETHPSSRDREGEGRKGGKGGNAAAPSES